MTPDDAPPLSPRYWLAIHGAAWGVVWIVLVFGVPWVASHFAGYGFPLSEFTSNVLWACRWPVPSTTVVLVVLAVDYVVMNRLDRRGDALGLRIWARWTLACAGIVLALMLWAVALPYFTIDHGLSG